MRTSPPLQVAPSCHRPTIPAVLTMLRDSGELAVLDSADTTHERGRYTIVAQKPIATRAWYAGGSDPFVDMQRELAQRVTDEAHDNLPFAGGWIGYFAYEAGRYIEKLPTTAKADLELPLARFALYDSAAIHDARTDTWTLVACEFDRSRETNATRIGRWDELLEGAASFQLSPTPPAPTLASPAHNMSERDYLDSVARAREYIAAGDIFQVNFARRETYVAKEPPIDTYLRLREVNPSAYATYLQWQDERHDHGPCAILSASPELFLDVDQQTVVTQPIKGTRPRSDDMVIDDANRAELATSTKDRAELAMIVDLLRNDLGRVCTFGSVRVEADTQHADAKPYALDTHPTVHHLSATIRGELAKSHDTMDLLRACFPGGSITGAPKVRAMEIIDELEPHERSVYTGSVGYFSFNGRATFNIAIRTLIYEKNRLHLYTGGGIVADSEPEMEYLETQAKALGLQRAIGAPLATDALSTSIINQESL